MTFNTGQEIALDPPQVAGELTNAGQWDIQSRICQGDREAVIQFRFSNAAPIKPTLSLEPVLALALIPAMKLRSPLRIRGEIDRKLLRRATRFQEIFSTWYPEFQPVPITAESPVERLPRVDDQRGVGLFFSGGIDSTYSLIKNRDELTHAIFFHGCDIPLSDKEYRNRTSRRLSEAAEKLGVQLIEVETDLLDFSDKYSHWGHHYHGCGLAAIAMLLSGSLRKVIIAATDTYNRVAPWGSSPLTDPLWSTSDIEIASDGGEKNRIDKAGVIAGEDEALRHLRVCFETPRGGYNCGRCEKCYRTMVALRICGVLDRCTAFDRPLDLGAMLESETLIKEARNLETWRVAREEAERRNCDPELIDALREFSRRREHDQFVREFAKRKDDIVASPQWRESLPKFRGRVFKSLRDEDPNWFSEKVVKWLPAIRDRAFARLWSHDRRWFKRQFRKARLSRFVERLLPGKKADR